MRTPAIEALREASALFVAGRLEEAKRACRKLLAKRPDIAEAHVLFGAIHQQMGDEARARESHARALKLRPGWSQGHVHLTIADLFSDYGRYPEAEAYCRRALELQPDLTDARYNLAGTLNALGRPGEAIAELQELLRRAPQAADVRQQLLELLYAERNFAEIEAVATAGIALHPTDASYANSLGSALWWRGQHQEAVDAFRLAAKIARGPENDEFVEARFREAGCLLSLGQYAEGWEAYQWRPTRRKLHAAHPELVADPRVVIAGGAPQRLRILSEQGLGDELFFLRFAPALRERGHRLSFTCPPKLASLLAAMPHVLDGVNEAGEEADLVLASGDLPLASGCDLAPPLGLPVDPQRRESMAAMLRAFGPPPYIAVTWRAGVMPDEPKPAGKYWAKQISPELIAQSLRPLDARIVIVQRRPQPDDLRQFTDALGREALNLAAMNDDLQDAIALLSLVDEYVAVSNTNLYLRTGVGRSSARVLVFNPPEWRWGLHGSASPWFPDFVLYRAAPGRDWADALSRLQRDTAVAMQQK
jgi:tetratricopeptide (TPR) repeat protein